MSTRPLSAMGSAMITSNALDPVGGDHEEAVLPGVVELAHLARVDPGQRPPSQGRQGVGEAVDVAQRAGEVEGVVELRGVEA